MKLKGIKLFVLLVFLWGTVFFSTSAQKAASENTIRLYNIGGQAAFTLLRGVIQGKIKTFKDVTKSLIYGSASGYGFYQAKKMISNGHVTTGIILANLSASVSENASYGDHPFAYLGYSLGPARIEVATPFAKKPQAIFNISALPSEIIMFIYSLNDANRISFRNGMITFIADEPIIESALGWTRGIFPTVLFNQPDYVFNHEAIHVVQHLQLMSISPEPFIRSKSNSDFKKSLINFSGMRINALGSVKDLLFNKLQSYRDNIFEVEAYYFTTE